MAINPNTQYPGQVATPNAAYPYGGAQNITTPGDNTGTPWEAALLNDILGMQQALLSSAGIVPSGSPEQVGASEYVQAMVELASGRAYNYDVTGTANAIVLTEKANQEPIRSLSVGLIIEFTVPANNTAAVTINTSASGVKALRKNNYGTALIANDLVSGRTYKARYNGTVYGLINDPKSIIITDTNSNYTAQNVDDVIDDLVGTGTWTPTAEGETTAGTGWVYAAGNSGVYRSGGQLAMVKLFIHLSTIGSGAAGNLLIVGLDTIPKLLHDSTADWFKIVVQYDANLSLTAGYERVEVERHNTNSDAFVFYEVKPDGTRQQIQISQVSAGLILEFGIIVDRSV